MIAIGTRNLQNTCLENHFEQCYQVSTYFQASIYFSRGSMTICPTKLHISRTSPSAFTSVSPFFIDFFRSSLALPFFNSFPIFFFCVDRITDVKCLTQKPDIFNDGTDGCFRSVGRITNVESVWDATLNFHV